ARVRVQDRAAAEGEDAVVLGEGLTHGLLLQGAEGRLAVLDEDVGDGASLRGDDVLVRVPVAGAEPFGEQVPDGGLADAHRADEDEQRGGGHRTVRWSR